MKQAVVGCSATAYFYAFWYVFIQPDRNRFL